MKRTIISCVAAALLMMPALFAHAGGPFVVDETSNSGVAAQWIDKTLSWSYDDGDFAPTVSNATAVGWIRDAMDDWAGVKMINPDNFSESFVTVDVQHQEVGSLGEDVTAENLEDFYYLSGVHALIVFDYDGSIMLALGYDQEATLGLTFPYEVDDTGLYLTRGIIILNGAILDYLGGGTTAQSLFRAALLHEVGHLYNLDHTQVNLIQAEACELDGTCDEPEYISTMFPILKTDLQNSLNRDDKITISWIYPSNDFKNNYCTIAGEILDENGTPLQGVNVIARRTNLAEIDSRSMVSGVLYPRCTSDGHYYLHGIMPGQSYQVTYEELSPEYSGASGFEPLPVPPSGFPSGTITSDGNTTVGCSNGGETIQMDSIQLPVTRSDPGAQGCDAWVDPGASASDTSSTGATKSSKCSMSPDARAPRMPWIVLIVLVPVALILTASILRRKRGTCRF